MRGVDFEPLTRSIIGFDRLFEMLENTMQLDADDNYPPYNIERVSEDRYRITLAVAGFRPEELSITVQPNQLTVTGKKSGEDRANYLYRGIAGRAFQRQFSLADYVEVAGADLKDGMLVIDLVRELPEALKPRRIEIGGSPRQIEGKLAA